MSRLAVCAAARRIALAQPGVAAADVAQDDECPMLRVAVHLRIAAGFDACEVAARTQEAIYRQLSVQELVIRVIDSDGALGRTGGSI